MQHAFRSLFRARSFTVTAIVIIALCLGANLTIFAVVDSVLLQPLPFPEADRLVTIFNTYPKAGVARDGASLTNYYERRNQISAFSSLAEVRPDSAIVGNAGSTERVETARVTPDFFATLGLPLRLGRSFDESETTYQTDGVVILTDAYWRERFNADPNVLNRTVRLDGNLRRIVGVLPPSFRFLSSPARIYVPLSSDPAQRGAANRHSGNSIMMVGRLAPGATISEAQSQINAHNAAIAESYPNAKMISESGFRSVVASLHGDHVKSVRPVLLLLQAGVLLLLLIGSVNLINLLLIRASARAKDFAIRQSMGATWRHVIRQIMSETMLLAAFGGIGGLLVAAFGIDLVRLLGAHRLPLGAQITFDGRVAIGALLGALVLGVLFALPVAAFSLRSHLASGLQSSSRTSTGNRTSRRLQNSFIVTQLALAFVLLSGAALLNLSLERIQAVSPGFQPDRVVSGQLTLPWQNYHGDAFLPFTERLTTELAHLPGISAVGATTLIPFDGISGMSSVTVKGHTPRPGDSVRGHYSYGITGDYFAAMGIRLRQGRFIDASDSRRADRSCVVDEAFAQRYWPNGDALGQRLFIGPRERDDAEALSVVGVVETVKQTELTEAEGLGTAYLPLAYRSDLQLFVVVRSSQPTAALGPTLQAAIRRLDPELPFADIKTMEDRIRDTLIARRSPALLTAVFAGVALLLAAVGTYGVLSYAVMQRQHEIGIRMALGAQAAQIGRQFLALGLRLLVIAMMLGLSGTWIAGRAMQSLLFEVPPLHLATISMTLAIVSSICLLACWLPARRAARVDPLVALRAE